MSDHLGIQCPQCQSVRLEVIDTRPGDECTVRRRKCRGCGFRFTTVEIIKADMIMSERHGNAIQISHAIALAARLKTSLEKMVSGGD